MAEASRSLSLTGSFAAAFPPHIMDSCGCLETAGDCRENYARATKARSGNGDKHLQDYLDASTPQERNHAALFVLLKFPNLSPLLRTNVPDFDTVEDNEYYLQDAWWCPPSDTEYNSKGDEVPKVVFKPVFLSAAQIEAARRERASLVTIGDAKSYLGKQTIAWARSAPADPRIPEALYIAVRANSGISTAATVGNTTRRLRRKRKQCCARSIRGVPGQQN